MIEPDVWAVFVREENRDAEARLSASLRLPVPCPSGPLACTHIPGGVPSAYAGTRLSNWPQNIQVGRPASRQESRGSWRLQQL